MLARYKMLQRFIRDYKHKLCLAAGGSYKNKSGLSYHHYIERRAEMEKNGVKMAQNSRKAIGKLVIKGQPRKL